MAGEPRYDVIVVGGGNAALNAALAARHHTERVLLLERAPAWMRGGNSRHTRDIRAAHDGIPRYTTGTYPVEEFLDDLQRVGGGRADPELARLVVRESKTLFQWMSEHGVRWQPALKGTLHLSRTNLFFLGGGKALVNTYYQTAARMGVEVRYEACVDELLLDGARVEGVVVKRDGAREVLRARAVVVASGGFEANLGWLKEYWGEAAENYIVRGTPYNDGLVLRLLIDYGAEVVGDPRAFHGVALDARAPKFDGGIVTRLDSVPFGIVVNQHCQRFYDEGEDFWPKRYAIWGGLIARQPGQIAYSIFDARMLDQFITSLYRPYEAPTIRELAVQLGLDPEALHATVETYNRHASRTGTFNPAVLDDCATRGLTPPKSHWAVPIEVPPFYAYPLRTGVTFTYMGVRVDERTRVQLKAGPPMANLFAAGEIMSGNILSSGYLAGFGLTIGTVFGRIAGREAARYGRG
ncbi:MAG TPA: FAD-dependent tricarballylate dehydrogenase TcuA [Chloroflexota bacterium]|nr:FAD-dependent tricarballylate dehydrogenase TcuA [Chloroflexota bacterium]